MYASGDGNSSGQHDSSSDRALAGVRASVEESSQINLVDVEQLGGATVAVEVRGQLLLCWPQPVCLLRLVGGAAQVSILYV
jgi:hypothetical protein